MKTTVDPSHVTKAVRLRIGDHQTKRLPTSRIFRSVLCSLLMLLPALAQSQQANGFYSGALLQPGGLRKNFGFAMQLTEDGSGNVSGTSHIWLVGTPYFGIMSLTGQVSSGVFTFQETQILSQNPPPGSTWCLKSGQLSVAANGDVLTGPWQGGSCAPGTINISQIGGKSLGNPSAQPGGCHCGDPITINSGNVFEQATDYETAGANKLGFTRFYNSRALSTSALELGANWRSNYDRYLQLSSSSVTAERPDGQQLTFTLTGSNWTTDTDVDVTLTNNGAVWTLTDHDDTVEAYTAINTTLALLTTVTARNGYTQTLAYNGSNQLTTVSDSYGRSLGFLYGSDGSLQTVTTADNTVLSYACVTNGVTLVLNSVTYPTTPVTSVSYVYDPNIQFALTGIIDESGNRYATWTYDGFVRGTTGQTGTGANANLITVSYDDTTGNRTVTNALGEQDIYKFTTLQGVPKLTEIDRQASSTTAAATRLFTYDANGYSASQTDWNTNKTSFVNDVHGQPTKITEPTRTTTISYDPTFVHLPHQIITSGLTTTFKYDTSGNLLTRTLLDTTTTTVPYVTKGEERIWKYTWSNFLLASVQTPRTDIKGLTKFTYDATGALTQIANALGQKTKITQHTGGGLPETILDPNNVTTTLAYDDRQRLVSSTVTTVGGARTTSYTYSAGSKLLTVTLPDGSALTNLYDTAERLIGVTDNLNDQFNLTLDANGDATQKLAVDPQDNTTFERTATFDALGRMLLDTSAVTGKSITYVYDNNGNALSVTDPLNHPTTQVFDALDRLTKSTDANSGVTSLAYDTHDRPTRVTAPVGVTTYVYDGFGDTIQQTSPDSGTTVYYYDPDGNLTQRVLAGGEVSNYTYDALDRALTATYPADATLNVAYTYDQAGHGFGVGRLTSLTDAAGSLSRSYDERGNLLTDARVNGGKTLTTKYSYDAASRIASITYPSGAAVTYTRDAAGRIASAAAKPPGKASATVTSSTTYLPFGAVNGFSFGNGIAETRTFDLDYRFTNLTDTGSASKLVQKLTYGFDAADNILSITDGVTAGNSQTLGYDVINRLTGATGAYGTLSYTYDKNGNRLSQKAGTVTTTYKYAAASNRLASFKTGTVTTTVSTNANGNITVVPPANSSTAASFVYNAANRLASVTGSPLAATFVYDAFGRRFSKTDGGSQPTTFFYAQDGALLEENNNGALTDYIYANGIPVATLTPSTGKLSFIHTDHLGTPQLATDSSQKSVWSTTYQPFGTTGLITGSITQNLRLPGQYADVETGFNQNGFRDYMPNLGRYLESDPIGLAGGLNTYGYVSENPVRFKDERGLDGFFDAVDAVDFFNLPGEFANGLAGEPIKFHLLPGYSDLGYVAGRVLRDVIDSYKTPPQPLACTKSQVLVDANTAMESGNSYIARPNPQAPIYNTPSRSPNLRIPQIYGPTVPANLDYHQPVYGPAADF